MEFKRYWKQIQVNGHAVSVQISVNVEDCTDEHEKHTAPKGFFWAYILVKAEALTLTGFDSLASCGVRENNAFNHAPFNTDIEDCIRNNGMEENAIKTLTERIETEYERSMAHAERFKKFSKGTK